MCDEEEEQRKQRDKRDRDTRRDDRRRRREKSRKDRARARERSDSDGSREDGELSDDGQSDGSIVEIRDTTDDSRSSDCLETTYHNKFEGALDTKMNQRELLCNSTHEGTVVLYLAAMITSGFTTFSYASFQISPRSIRRHFALLCRKPIYPN